MLMLRSAELHDIIKSPTVQHYQEDKTSVLEQGRRITINWCSSSIQCQRKYQTSDLTDPCINLNTLPVEGKNSTCDCSWRNQWWPNSCLVYSLHLPYNLSFPHWQNSVIACDFFVDNSWLKFVADSLEEVPDKQHGKQYRICKWQQCQPTAVKNVQLKITVYICYLLVSYIKLHKSRDNISGSSTYAHKVWFIATEFGIVTHVGEGPVSWGSATPYTKGTGNKRSQFLGDSKLCPHGLIDCSQIWQFGRVFITCGEWHVSRGQMWPLSQAAGPQCPQIFGTFFICPHGMTKSNQILHSHQTK